MFHGYAPSFLRASPGLPPKSTWMIRIKRQERSSALWLCNNHYQYFLEVSVLIPIIRLKVGRAARVFILAFVLVAVDDAGLSSSCLHLSESFKSYACLLPPQNQSSNIKNSPCITFNKLFLNSSFFNFHFNFFPHFSIQASTQRHIYSAPFFFVQPGNTTACCFFLSFFFFDLATQHDLWRCEQEYNIV